MGKDISDCARVRTPLGISTYDVHAELELALGRQDLRKAVVDLLLVHGPGRGQLAGSVRRTVFEIAVRIYRIIADPVIGLLVA